MSHPSKLAQRVFTLFVLLVVHNLCGLRAASTLQISTSASTLQISTSASTLQIGTSQKGAECKRWPRQEKHGLGNCATKSPYKYHYKSERLIETIPGKENRAILDAHKERAEK